MNSFEANWFKKNKNHSIENRFGERLPHEFFDLRLDFSDKSNSANVVILHSPMSQDRYKLDLSSGQKYFSRKACHKLTAYEGFLPRTFDQTGEPQKVFFYSKRALTRFTRVKFMFSVMESFCQSGDCDIKKTWLKRQVLIGVAEEDVGEFKLELADMEELKRTIQLDQGSISPEISKPQIKWSDYSRFEDSKKYFLTKTIFLGQDYLDKMQASCFKLYDSFKKSITDDQFVDLGVSKLDEAKLRDQKESELRKQRLPVNKVERLSVFLSTFGQQWNTCQRLVYHGNLNSNSDYFWKTRWLQVFISLHEKGYFFNCKQKVWQTTFIREDGEWNESLPKNLKECSLKDFDIAISLIPIVLKTMRDQDLSFDFVSYDMGQNGTHAKIYNWVAREKVYNQCENNLNSQRSLPENLKWKGWVREDSEAVRELIR